MRRKNILGIFLIGIPLFWNCLSCTKLNTEVYDQVTNFWQTPDQVAAGVAPAYSGLRNYAPANEVYSLNEVSTDEIIVPIRGGDWNDNGMWQKLWKHTWGPDHPFVSSVWDYVYTGIARVNSILQTVNAIAPKPGDFASIQAELKTIRAFYYFLALDLFGNVPIVEDNEADLSKLGNKSRTEVFSFVEKEIKDNLSDLTPETTPASYGMA